MSKNVLGKLFRNLSERIIQPQIMKLFIITLILTLISLKSFGQDTITTYSGNKIICKVVEISENAVKFKFVGEDVISSVLKTNFISIKLESGRTIEGTPRIMISNEYDWGKVQITRNPNEVEGLVKVSEIKEKAVSAIGAYGNLEKMKIKAYDGLKKQAAKMGCHIILIIEDDSREGKTNQAFKYTKASYTGVAYKYNCQTP